MDFALSRDQLALRRWVVAFARGLGGDAAEHDRLSRLDRAGWRACAEFGVLGWVVPSEYGGAGLDPLSAIVAYEALGYGCVDNGLVFAVNNHVFACAVYLLDHGTAEQRKRYLPALCDGSTIGAHALTEPNAGSDVLSLTTRARRTDSGYELSGTKTFISNGPVADLFLVFARTSDDGPAQRALSAFLVPKGSPGLTVTREFQKAGLRGTPMGELVFDRCPVPEANRLGEEGDGYRIFTSTAEWERGYMFASQVGVLNRILDRCVGYATSRRQFGRPIGEFQAVSHTLADMRVRLELSRLLLYKVGWLKSRGRLALNEAAMLKLYVSEALRTSALEAMQIHGARGFVSDFGIEREVRDALAATVWGGTSQMQRELIAGLLGLPRSGA